jgi:hypothetical protein
MTDEINNENTVSSLADPESFMLEEPFLNESIVSVELSNIRQLCESILSTTNSCSLENQQHNLEIIADCQKQAAVFANAVLERHALHPAIETVFTLRNLLQDLSEQSTSLVSKQITCYLIKPILNSISEAVKIANDKCEYLGIGKISPDELDDFDAKEHEIRQTVPTDDSSKHKKIYQTLIPGLMYRGKVLKLAQVSVYCLNLNSERVEK